MSLKLSINKSLANLTPEQFEKWFAKRKKWVGEDWRKHYIKIGGKLPKDGGPSSSSEKPKKS